MKALVLKELKSVFCSAAGAFFALAFYLIMGMMLWFFDGRYNIIDGGYADLERFFSLAAPVFAVLIPALTMRLFAEEKKNKTFDILRSRPVNIPAVYFSKYVAILIFILITLLPTVIYVCSLQQLSNPIGNVDLAAITASYISLILIINVFISIGLFGSAITKNQIVALIISVFLCLFSFYGFDLAAGLFLSGKVQIAVSLIGLLQHYKSMQRGVIGLSEIFTVVNYLLVFISASIIILSLKKKTMTLCFIVTILILNVIFLFLPNLRIDFTSDKRYTLSDFSRKILNDINKEKELYIEVYLDGDLNYGFQHLRNATNNLLADFNSVAHGNININFKNPYQQGASIEDIRESFSNKGMHSIMLNEVDREGKASRKMIFPYAQVTNGSDTLVVSLLKNVAGNTAEENLNASVESLEFEFIDAIRLLNQDTVKTIAFIEGHDELPRSYVYDAERLLSKYYSVNRGEIGTELGILDDFAAIIIAGPLQKYSEAEKYIIDQYIMRGGKVLWLIDGVYYSHQDLATTGRSASMKNDLNLDDMLFTYGVRINPDLIQDRQCISVYLITDEKTQTGTVLPSFFQPLFIPSADNPVTKNIRDVKGGFASSIDILNNSNTTKKSVLLTSSQNTHLLQVPEVIDFDVERIQNIPDYFNQQFIPTAVSLEGNFTSVFVNRTIPDSIQSEGYKTIIQSKNTKMIFVSSSDIISNQLQGKGQDTMVLPMGYDKVSQQQFGNPDFIVNAVNWLTDDDGLMKLRTKQQRLYILNKKKAFEERDKYALMNTALPILFMGIVMGSIFVYRKRKYER
ncbi:gliding motility-associated ABC transporter substrate-binding protein GldG [Prevotella sp. 10(H)]|uniref:gliding motility-associated ABC transporter substrate-binding protein GldG n=1 Tax=Prevotella sp. 10(H) TaxID=1158294 RepID=UPI0004A7238D|nr:gliding motility-associated ABC transporter substrate-binding protein GldG [Prevotella sp. 10(H)]